MYKVGRLNSDCVFITYAVCPDEYLAKIVCDALGASGLVCVTVPLNY